MIAGRSTPPGGARGDGAARGALLAGLDATLTRIGTDHHDLWQLPGFDATVPLEETLSAVQVAVSAGKVRYAGLVAPRGWQLATVAKRARTLPLSVALAWVRDRPGVAAAVVGARDAAQLSASTTAEAVVLPAEIRAALDDVSDPA